MFEKFNFGRKPASRFSSPLAEAAEEDAGIALDAHSSEVTPEATKQTGRTTFFEPREGDAALAYGLEWHALDGLGAPEAQARRFASKHGAKRFTIVRPNKASIEPLVGLVPKGTKLPKQKTVEAAAAVFALAVREAQALYMGPGPTPGSYVLIGLLSGVPSPEFDIVAGGDEVLAVAEHYQTYLTEGATLYAHDHLTGDSPDLDSGIDEYIRRNATVVRVVPSIPYETAAGKHSGGTMTAIGSSQMLILVGAAVLVLAGLIGGFLFYQDWSAKNSAAAKNAALKAAALTTYKNSLETAFKSAGVQQVAPAAKAIWAHVQEQPTLRNGWRVTSVTCVSGSCEAIFERTRASTFQTFKDSTKAGESASMALAKLDQASATFQIPNWDQLALVDLEKVEVKDVTVPLGSQAQLMELAGLAVAVTPTAPLGDSAMATARNVPVKKYGAGVWTITGPVDTLLPAVTRLPGNASLTSLKFNIVENDVTFVANGRYFVSAN